MNDVRRSIIFFYLCLIVALLSPNARAGDELAFFAVKLLPECLIKLKLPPDAAVEGKYEEGIHRNYGLGNANISVQHLNAGEAVHSTLSLTCYEDNSAGFNSLAAEGTNLERGFTSGATRRVQGGTLRGKNNKGWYQIYSDGQTRYIFVRLEDPTSKRNLTVQIEAIEEGLLKRNRKIDPSKRLLGYMRTIEFVHP